MTKYLESRFDMSACPLDIHDAGLMYFDPGARALATRLAEVGPGRETWDAKTLWALRSFRLEGVSRGFLLLFLGKFCIFWCCAKGISLFLETDALAAG
jgi:hypothetical protein